jgi:hypothetical protein
MKTKTTKTKLSAFTLLAALFLAFPATAQVTIGSGLAPTRLTLLELKTRQAQSVVSNVGDDENISSETGGFLLPRVKLVSTNTLQPFIDPFTDDEWLDPVRQKALRMSLAGLMVYNINTVGDGSTIYPAIYSWDGERWSTSQANPSKMEVADGGQPKAFTFYETGEETVQPLTFGVSGATGAVTYRWYQVTGTNVHVRVGTPIGEPGTISGTGANSASFTPGGVIKTTAGSKSTRYGQNNGFYKFYCEATDSYGKMIQSAIAEVAVGCGAKNNAGEWISFMCFNLGADNNSTIESQKNYAIGSYTNDPGTSATPGRHDYISNEEKLWGSLFQWGRIADGHELRSYDADGNPTNIVDKGLITISDISNSFRCSTTESDIQRPYQQIKKGTAWYGNFIYGNSAWTPVAQTTSDVLWRSGRFVQNDPCAHYKVDGTYQEFWHEGTDTQNRPDMNNPAGPGNEIYEACTDAGTAWHTPAQDEWGSLYKGGTISGSPATATANTWTLYGGTGMPVNTSRGYEIKPDGSTTTLFLPASGYRHNGNGLLYYQGSIGYYWSISIINTSAYSLYIGNGDVNPAGSNYRASGFALRCIKN